MYNNTYSDGFIIYYNEGDRSLERKKILHLTNINDSLYIIKQGDDLLSISYLFYGVSHKWFIIADINDILNPFELVIGSSLIIPKDIEDER